MKFLCTKVRDVWIEKLQNKAKVESLGLNIKENFIGIELKQEFPSEEEIVFMNNAVQTLFAAHVKAFPVRTIDL